MSKYTNLINAVAQIDAKISKLTYRKQQIERQLAQLGGDRQASSSSVPSVQSTSATVSNLMDLFDCAFENKEQSVAPRAQKPPTNDKLSRISTDAEKFMELAHELNLTTWDQCVFMMPEALMRHFVEVCGSEAKAKDYFIQSLNPSYPEFW